jgi:hypothetical protein
MRPKLTLRFQILSTGSVHEVEGQFARTLIALHEAGDRGITALEMSSWALRLAHYVFMLRKAGLAIDMEREKHEGQAPGLHGRYFLRTGIHILSEMRSAA